ncbi:DNA/RNA helicase domain-containing protein [Pseudokineococcus sp. 5B2Z-1]|uniref:DNA/RNA helicase domain-containing protein n=1 Tax=Pseudokineococcus sp. 5B2Z-1 TaxID=3132744 RepID=UPI00403F92D2
MDAVTSGDVAVELDGELHRHAGHRALSAEARSWRASIPVLVRDLHDAGLGDVQVLLEYRLPLTSRRIDAVLAGTHPRTGKPSYVAVELKQWSSFAPFEEDQALVTVPDVHEPRLHPLLQVDGYREYLVDFTKALHEEPDLVRGAAYVHNARAADMAGSPTLLTSRIFGGDQRDEWLGFLREHLAPAPGKDAAERLSASAARPSRTLLAVAAEEIQQREHLTLLADQQLAYRMVLHEVERASRGRGKTVVVVTGGPGSGKSVVALSLLGELARRGYRTLHATGSRSFTQTLRKVAGRGSSRTKSLFTYFNSYMQAEPDGLDVLVMDEAHRIRRTSEARWTRAELRTGRPQLDELVSAARVPVLLLDENQVVRPGEIGSVEAIREYARAHAVRVVEVDLADQFRCGGSDTYVRWVRDLLGLTDTGPTAWRGTDFDLRVADSPAEMEAFLAERLAEGRSARMTAGFCWSWSDPRRDGTLVPDVQVGSWARPWNLKGDRRIGSAPASALWATEEGGFGQVGCVYTAQGFEYDWNGVILGPDLVWRDGTLRTDRSANKDPDFRSRAAVDDVDFDRLVRHVYKVLLTRGMVGTVVYAVDPDLQAALKRFVSGT